MRPPELLRDLGFSVDSALAGLWTEVNGRSVYSRSSTKFGRDAAPFVLIHGLVISSLYMIPLAELLAEASPVHALDLPGFGRSKGPRNTLSIRALANVVIEWMDAAKIDECHLFANSMGCEVAAHVAVIIPKRVLSLTLVGPTVDPQILSVSAQIFGLIRDATHEPPRLWANWIFDFFRAGLRRSIGTTREMFRDNIRSQLPLITSPTLIMRGETDPVVPQSAAEEMRNILPNGKLEVFKAEPHCVHFTQPERVRAALRDFISSQSEQTDRF